MNTNSNAITLLLIGLVLLLIFGVPIADAMVNIETIFE